MPRLNTFELKITYGSPPINFAPLYEINGFEVALEQTSSTQNSDGSENIVLLSGSPLSFPHSLSLIGPPEGNWEIAHIEATYHVPGDTPYTIHLGAVSLDSETKLNIWHPRPPTFLDV